MRDKLQGALGLSFALVVTALLLDFLQYILFADIFGYYLIKHEARNKEADAAGIERPTKVVFGRYARMPGKAMYHAKYITLTVAYCLLAWELICRISSSPVDL
jgi:hypothetical protein